jgi:hypothetical protein
MLHLDPDEIKARIGYRAVDVGIGSRHRSSYDLLTFGEFLLYRIEDTHLLRLRQLRKADSGRNEARTEEQEKDWSLHGYSLALGVGRSSAQTTPHAGMLQPDPEQPTSHYSSCSEVLRPRGWSFHPTITL